MKLKSVTFQHLAILGSSKIDFFGKSSSLSVEELRAQESSLKIDLDKTAKGNHYTYIIGENGVGKTGLFRVIINEINNLTRFDSETKRIQEFTKFHHIPGLSEKFKSKGLEEVRAMSLYNFVHGRGENLNFLNTLDSQLIYISSPFDKPIISPSDRFRNFNNISSINKIETLFLKAIVKFREGNKLDLLNEILGIRDASWKLDCWLGTSGINASGAEPHKFILTYRNGINVLLFLDIVKKIKITEENKLNQSSLSERELLAFETMYSSSAFFKLFSESNLNMESLFTNIASSTVFKAISDLIYPKEKKDERYYELLDEGKIRLPSDRFLALINDPGKLNLFDTLLISLLSDLHLIELNIMCNGIPVSKMSSGEQNIIKLFSFFSDLPKKGLQENLLLFYDEPEISLHPKWQHNFPLYFKRIVEEIYGITNSHFFFATHSPLIIMKCATMEDCNVLEFSREHGLKSKEINDINSYSIEEVLLDEFKISYRSSFEEIKITKMLRKKNKDFYENEDPLSSVSKSFEIRKLIDEMYDSLEK